MDSKECLVKYREKKEMKNARLFLAVLSVAAVFSFGLLFLQGCAAMKKADQEFQKEWW